MFKLSIALVIFVFAIELNGQSPFPIPELGKCADSPVISDFDAGKVSHDMIYEQKVF